LPDDDDHENDDKKQRSKLEIAVFIPERLIVYCVMAGNLF